ncbi:MAG: radical SAM protein [Chloroflexota bacterium]|nr:radical SAM protein [Chloroflexota bacterium]
MTTHAPSDDFPVRWQHDLANGHQIRVMVRPNAINLLIDEEHPSYTFDPLGRLHGAFQGGFNYRRSLDNRTLCKWRIRVDNRWIRQRRWLAEPESRALLNSARQWAILASEQSSKAPPAIQESLERIAGWSWDRLQENRQKFQQIYTPIGILPPDQYLALVVQATHGCTHNACTFCTFYQDIHFRTKTPEQFRQHVAAVMGFFGPAVAMRRSIFLGDANALVLPMGRLLALLQVLEESLKVEGRASLPIFAFMDAFNVHRKSRADWQELKARGLRRVTIGVESGHDPLLRWLNKPGSAAQMLDAVTMLKSAGLQASVILMLGVGGTRYADAHVKETLALLNAMPLAEQDLIYLSDFVEMPGSAYGDLARQVGIVPATYEELRRQEEAIKSGFLPRWSDRAPRFARYSVQEFIY